MSDTNKKIDELLKVLDKTNSSIQTQDSLDEQDPLKKVIEVSSKIKPSGESDLDDLWSSFQDKIEVADLEEKADETVPTHRPKTIFFNKYRIGIAASISLLFACLFLFYQYSSVEANAEFVLIKEVKKGEQGSIVLPDGSKVWLNAYSKLYQQGDWSNLRSLKLEGEGFFDVKKGTKFSVLTEYGLVEVLGTSFNIFAYEGQSYRVLCQTGKVKVIVDKAREVAIEEILVPGEELEVKKTEILKSIVSIKESSMKWKEGVFKFKEESLYTVIRELERQFDVSIEIDRNIDKLFTGAFSNKDLNIALQTVCAPLGLRYSINKGVVSIK